MQHNNYWLQKRANRKTGFPLATIAHYGPDNRTASKVVVGIFETEKEEPDELVKWFSTKGTDTRVDEDINTEIIEFLKAHNIHRVVMLQNIFGCPHEEKIDYPEGETCQQCPYWATHDRLAAIKINR